MWWSRNSGGPRPLGSLSQDVCQCSLPVQETLLSAVVQSRRAGIRGPFHENMSRGLCLSGWPWQNKVTLNPGFGISCANSPCWLMSHLRGRWSASRANQVAPPQPALALGCHYICTPSPSQRRRVWCLHSGRRCGLFSTVCRTGVVQSLWQVPATQMEPPCSLSWMRARRWTKWETKKLPDYWTAEAAWRRQIK